jgi:serine/threonine protein phosphatase PrpC
MKYKLFCFMDIGPRAQQEDCILISSEIFQENQLIKEGSVSSENLLLAVCDGMGGHEAGEKASRFVCEQLKDWSLDGKYSHNRFENNFRLIQKKALKHLPPKSGCTIAGLIIKNDRIHIFNAGDSRVYKITYNGIEYLSHDHSAVQDLLDRQLITAEQAFNHHRKNEISLGIGPVFYKDWQMNINCYSIRNANNTMIPRFDDKKINTQIDAAEVYASQDLFGEAAQIYQALLAQTAKDNEPAKLFFQNRLHALKALKACPQELYMHFYDDTLLSDSRYLICSDGVNDILRDQEIFRHLSYLNSENCGMALVKALRKKGFKDNTSFILAEGRRRPGDK